MDKLSVAIADDNENMVRLLSDIVRNDEELQVIGTAKDGEEAYEMIRTKEPDVVLLDIGGKELGSPEFAAAIDRAYLSAPEITFVIGGSCGVDERVRAAANLRVSFGKVTYPHQLMRLILAEQIYRAFNILAGTPYHK